MATVRQRGVYEITHPWVHGLRLMAEIILPFSWQKHEEARGFGASGKQLSRDLVAAWCLVACLEFFHHFPVCVFQNQEVMSRQQAQPLLLPEEEEGPR